MRRGATPAFPPARKRFGQNFLEPAWVDKVVSAAALEPTDHVLEIGPGRGALTRRIAPHVSRMLAYEIDRDLAALLEVDAPAGLSVHVGDFLEVPAEQIVEQMHAVGMTGPVRVVGNLPYNVASPILFKLVELHGAGVPFVDATVMLQREVAERLLAGPGTGEYGVLTVLIGYRAACQRLLGLPPGAFRPIPKVHSTLVRLTFHAPEPNPKDLAGFQAMVQAMFNQRRKTLSNALSSYASSTVLKPAEALARAGIDPTRRPETLSLTEMVTLSDVFGADPCSPVV